MTCTSGFYIRTSNLPVLQKIVKDHNLRFVQTNIDLNLEKQYVTVTTDSILDYSVAIEMIDLLLQSEKPYEKPLTRGREYFLLYSILVFIPLFVLAFALFMYKLHP
jgi:hypothetical protein